MERKKKILIAIYNLAAGGAQKSLVSLFKYNFTREIFD